MNKRTLKFIIAIAALMTGIGLQVMSAHKKNQVETYRKVPAVIEEFYEQKSVRAVALTRMLVSYDMDGIRYESVIEEPYMIGLRVGDSYTVYCSSRAPSEAVSASQFELRQKTASLPGYFGWVLIAAAAALILSAAADIKKGRGGSTVRGAGDPLYTGQIEVYRSSPEYEESGLPVSNRMANAVKKALPAVLVLAGIALFVAGVCHDRKILGYEYTKGSITEVYETKISDGTVRWGAVASYTVEGTAYKWDTGELGLTARETGTEVGIYYSKADPSDAIDSYEYNMTKRMGSMLELAGCVSAIPGIIMCIRRLRRKKITE